MGNTYLMIKLLLCSSSTIQSMLLRAFSHLLNIQPVYFFQNLARVGIGASEDSAAAFVKPQLIQCVYSSNSEIRVGSLVFPILVVCWLVNCSKREEKMEL